MPDTDVLVVGSGVAGLAYALQLHALEPEVRITLVTKDRLHDSSSSFAQGGIAAVTDFTGDSFEDHIRDTLDAGDGLCDPTVVDFVVREAPARVNDLSQWGVSFDKGKHGRFDLAREGGHSARRILHTADCTGAEIIQKLIASVKRTQIKILEGHTVADLFCQDNMCSGASLLSPEGSRYAITSRMTLLATGGLGQVFKHTTNPAVATGDGIAMAWRAGAGIADMEFIQFHPTALWQPEPGRSFLISEAVRGAGAVMRNTKGERFMHNYDPRMELATRDIVSRAVQNEMRRTGSGFVYIDATGIAKKEFQNHFPNILAACLRRGIDPSNDFIPVAPSAHYCCGGIVTDHLGRSSIKNLYAAGECARTGLHGANRLASNSLLEALVFAHRAALDTASALNQNDDCIPKFFEIRAGIHHRGPFGLQTDLLKEKMSAASILIREEPLKEAYDLVRYLRGTFHRAGCGTPSPESVTYGNLLDAAWLVVTAWMSRKHNAGAYFREHEHALA